MTQYDNTNRWILSRNDRRRNDKDAEFTGTINVEGVEYWLNAWVQEKKDGSGKFFSGSIKRKEPMTIGPDDPPMQRRSMKDQLNDEIPF
jgi:hypothetical protein